MGWTWENATPTERAIAVRHHARIPCLSLKNLCRLFNLTTEGAWAIVKGADWHPDHDMDVERERRLTMIRAAAARADGQYTRED